MHPFSIMSFYPTYEILDSIVYRGNYEQINLFIDLKNTMKTIFIEECIREIVNLNKKSNGIDTSIFSSIIPFLAFHKFYCARRGIDINFYLFLESGDSSYHKNINENYKVSRKVKSDSIITESERREFTKVFESNAKLIEGALNRIPDVHVFKLNNIEADFIPHYLISRNKVNKNNANLIYSNDHDLWQCCRNDNTFIFSKGYKKKKEIIEYKNIMKKLLKMETNIPNDAFTLAMSIIGDKGDDIDGVSNIGPKSFNKVGERLIELLGGIPNLINNIKEGKSIIYEDRIIDEENKLNKILDSEWKHNTITNNMKQIDFEIISYFVENELSHSLSVVKNQIDSIIYNKENSSFDALYRALVKNKVFFQDEDLELVFWRKEPQVSSL